MFQTSESDMLCMIPELKLCCTICSKEFETGNQVSFRPLCNAIAAATTILMVTMKDESLYHHIVSAQRVPFTVAVHSPHNIMNMCM